MTTTSGSFLALSTEEAQALVVSLGGRPFHAAVVRTAALDRGVVDYADLTSLPRSLRASLAAELPLVPGREVDRRPSPDGTVKLLVEFPAERGGGSVETVHMPSRRAGRGATLCVSTQVGCPVGCPFCASGALGLKRNLAADEIVEQFVRGKALGPLSRAVVMGIGEPLLNYRALCEALEVVRAEVGLGARKITVSTVGFPERVARAARDRPPFELAISLHSPDDEERARLVPAMADVPVEDVLRAGDAWFAGTGREPTYEYVLLGGTNDDDDHALRLAARLRGRRGNVNLIPYNPVPGGAYGRPAPRRAERFRTLLQEAGVVATVRWSRGVDTDAACGQLRIGRLGRITP